MQPLGDLVVRRARLVAAPGEPPVADATVVVRRGVVTHAGHGEPDEPPPDADELDADGATVVAGFWNCHVHLTTRALAGARRRPAAELAHGLADLLTSHGFTTVADLASDPRNTLPMRARIEAGELPGPRILTAGTAIHPHRGLPFYTKESVPRWLWWALPTPRTPRGARAAVRRQLRGGADLTKLFTGSYVTPTTIEPMRLDNARAAVETAHEHGVLVFAHTSNEAGLRVALDAGVDVVAHVPDETEGTEPLLRRAAESGVWLVPTFQMFARTVTEAPSYLDPIVEAARGFLAAGGRLAFGTDVGYMADATIDDELRYLARCGLDADAVLASLTTGPAELFGEAATSGRIAPGCAGDLVVLDGDPWQDVQAFARVRRTVRAGRVVWPLPPAD